MVELERVIYVVDVDRSREVGQPQARADALCEIGEGCEVKVVPVGWNAEAPGQEGLLALRGVVGHHKDLQKVEWLTDVSCPIVRYSGRGRAIRGESVGANDHVIPWEIDHGDAGVQTIASHAAELSALFIWLRDGGVPPTFLETTGDLLAPLLAFGVLLDGYIVAFPDEDPEAWFKPAVNAALAESPPTGRPVGSQEYWSDLRGSEAAIKRLQKMLEMPEIGTPSFVAIRKEAKDQGWFPGGADEAPQDYTSLARAVYESACHAVEVAWSGIAGSPNMQGMPRGTSDLQALVEAASVGFHVLAAGHL